MCGSNHARGRHPWRGLKLSMLAKRQRQHPSRSWPRAQPLRRIRQSSRGRLPPARGQRVLAWRRLGLLRSNRLTAPLQPITLSDIAKALTRTLSEVPGVGHHRASDRSPQLGNLIVICGAHFPLGRFCYETRRALRCCGKRRSRPTVARAGRGGFDKIIKTDAGNGASRNLRRAFLV
jgi:hypothetical protein